jgi:hypothetical protein
MAWGDSPIQPSKGAIQKRPRRFFEVTAEPPVLSPGMEVLVGLGVLPEKPLPEVLRVLVTPGGRHWGEPVASRKHR